MLDYSETSEDVYLAFNQHIGLKNKKFKILVHLTFKYRIEFKILLFTFKAIHGMAPDYICKLVHQKTPGRYSLRSSQRIILEIPSGKILSTLGGRAFCYSAPYLWNNLPREITSLNSLSSFKCHLKTYLFKQAFNL